MPNKFLADAMLGRLAKWLRIMGYDAQYRSFYLPGQIRFLMKEGRIFLTRNSSWRRHPEGIVFIGPDHVKEQLRQLQQEGLIPVDRATWFSRCMLCNVPLLDAPLEAAGENVPEYVLFRNPSGIRFCPSCNRFFWPGTHRRNMVAQLEAWGF